MNFIVCIRSRRRNKKVGCRVVAKEIAAQRSKWYSRGILFLFSKFLLYKRDICTYSRQRRGQVYLAPVIQHCVHVLNRFRHFGLPKEKNVTMQRRNKNIIATFQASLSVCLSTLVESSQSLS
jgi:hypothetical protein